MTSNLMGLDLSLTSTGFSVNGQTGTISTSLKGMERLDFISTNVISIAKERDVWAVMVEGYSFASRNSQAHSIGELGGIVRFRLWKLGIPYVEIPPTSRAKFATGRGNAAKTEVMSAISARTGIVWSGKGADDQCDAWILEQIGLAYLGKSEIDWPATNREALKKIDFSPLHDNTLDIGSSHGNE